MLSYNEIYLDDAMKNLGEAFDYAVNNCGQTPDEFMDLFIVSGISEYYEKGNPKYLSGKSGTELVMDILDRTGYLWECPGPRIDYEYSPEYWAGWILTYYQWSQGVSFRDIHHNVSMDEILSLYPTLHEASEEKFCDVLNNRLKNRADSTKLQQQRRLLAYSQSELSRKAQINLRTLQQYEIGAKDLSKASVRSVMSLATALGCSIEDLIDDRTK